MCLFLFYPVALSVVNDERTRYETPGTEQAKEREQNFLVPEYVSLVSIAWSANFDVGTYTLAWHVARNS